MATYITYKELYESGKKDVYDVIAAFIKNTVISEEKVVFTRTELADSIEKKFGIRVPDLVLHSATKRLNGVERKNKQYLFNLDKYTEDSVFNLIQSQSVRLSENIIKQCVDFINNEEELIKDSYSEKEIQDGFLKYLLDDKIDSKLGKYFGKFILENSKNESFINQLNTIKQGQILFIGLSYNDNVGSIQKMNEPLVVFLDMEILFNLVGYNGPLYKKISMDFLEIVNQINDVAPGSIILKYFDKTSKDIEKFFGKAEIVVENNETVNPGLPAMISIIKNCKSGSDVVDQYSDFLVQIHNMGIIEDDRINYYNPKYDQFNLEDDSIIKQYSNDESDYYDNATRLALISNINKLRLGKLYTDYLLCHAILLTETRNTLLMSNDYIAQERNDDSKQYVQLAVSLFTLTNLLWYRFNGKISNNELPSNNDCVLRSQVILSSLVSGNIVGLYEKSMQEYEKGDLSKEQLTARISGLRKKSNLLDNFNSIDSVNEAMEFLTSTSIDEYDEEISFLENEKKKAEEKVQDLENRVRRSGEELIDKQKKIDEQEVLLANKEKELETVKLEMQLHIKQKEYDDLTDKYDECKKNKDKKTKQVKKWLTIIIALIAVIIIVLICILGWNVMEPITYICGMIYTGILLTIGLWKNDFGTSKLIDIITSRLFSYNQLKIINDCPQKIASIEDEIKELKKTISIVTNGEQI